MASVSSPAIAQVGSLPVLDPIADVTAPPGGVTDVPVHASDPDGEPVSFATNFAPAFVTTMSIGPNDGIVRVAPGAGDVGSAVITVVAADPLEGADWATFTATIVPPEGSPVAYAGGPYFGGYVEFDGTRSADPDGSPLAYLWDFGDGAFGTGPTPVHSYPWCTPTCPPGVAGSYVVTLTVSDPDGNSSRGSTYVIVTDLVVFGHTFPSRNQPFLKVPSGRATLCFQIQGPGLDVRYVDLSSVRIRALGGEASAIDSKSSPVGDTNKDGLVEVRACFRGEDIDRMLTSLPPGRSLVRFEVSGSLTLVGRFLAWMDLEVFRTGNSLVAAARPNPVRSGSGAIEFDTDRAGEARVEIYDVSGRRVRNLLAGIELPPGHHRVAIESRADREPLPSGIYFYRVQVGEARTSGKLVVAR